MTGSAEIQHRRSRCTTKRGWVLAAVLMQEADESGMSASHSLTALRLQLRWRLRIHIAAVKRRKAFTSAHGAAACPTYTTLFSHRQRLAQQIRSLVEHPQTRLQLRSATAGSPLDGVRYTFRPEVSGLASHAGEGAVSRRAQPWRLALDAWRGRAAGHECSESQPLVSSLPGEGPPQAAASGAGQALTSPSVKRFVWGGGRTNRSRDGSPTVEHA